ncbi:hypothetical protein SBI_00661 [Streptomyces bingchenggensis BCW-1]|uniref:Beta-ketoacyl synthase-like N-terminal domain-containing protein n=1 Tax=Streptomyces bingchenggensis (strain BCW-1) TaxID=749414 RepID=D7C2C8_STRBB|nr:MULTISPECIES: beta-ketoacyl synthase N-terminal-like domain-containing protein [Streptomyces]ADI03782.1 hypothetical protein SBI_00661 [Streptomyces bingchenggensis BCW-1]
MPEKTISNPLPRFAREEQSGDIAIIGLSCRLPGGIAAPEELWAALAAGRDLGCVVPAMELATAAGVRQLAPRILGRVRRGA